MQTDTVASQECQVLYLQQDAASRRAPYVPGTLRASWVRIQAIWAFRGQPERT